MDETLLERIAPVAKRLRFRRIWATMGVTWFLLSLLVLTATFQGYFDLMMPNNRVLLVAAISALVSLFAMLFAFAYGPNFGKIGQLIEQKYPDLDSRLLTAMEIRPDQNRRYNFLQQDVLRQAFTHSLSNKWSRIVPVWQLYFAPIGSVMALGLLIAATLSAMFHVPEFFKQNPPSIVASVPPEQLKVTVEPGDTEVELNSSLLVLATFDGGLPSDVQLTFEPLANGVSPTQDSGNETQELEKALPEPIPAQTVTMKKRLDDPVYSSQIPSIKQPLRYRVAYDGIELPWHTIKVFQYPSLERADAVIQYPSYTGLSEKSIVDVRRLSAVEGSTIRLQFHFNKEIEQLHFQCTQFGEQQDDLSDHDVLLTGSALENKSAEIEFLLQESCRYQVLLRDSEGRENRFPPKFQFTSLVNQPPQLKVLYPARDLEVSALEELMTSAEVWDDFQVERIGITVSRPGKDDLEFSLGQSLNGQSKHLVQHTVMMEDLNVQADDLVSHFFWAEDLDSRGQIRRVFSDIFFAEVRPFDQIFRQGQQPTAGQMQRQQQNQGGQQGGQNAQQATELAEQQKQTIAATWNLMRRKDLSPEVNLSQDISVVIEAQSNNLQQVLEMTANVSDPQSKAFVESAQRNMNQAVEQLTEAAASGSDQETATSLKNGLTAEQAAYQDLLRLREREFEVVRSQQQQQQSQQSQSSSSSNNRSQQQMQQLDLSNEQNRYEEERTADTNPNQSEEAQEDRQILNRLSELAKRQEDLVDRINELQSALQEAETQEAQEEIQRRLKSLQEQQQDLMRDAEELSDRMQQENNQQRMSEQAEQLDNARQDMQQTNQALQQNELSQAAAQGSRAENNLQQLEDEFQRRTSSQFNQTMQDMRQEAREIEKQQQEILQQLQEQQPVSTRPSLREEDQDDSLLDKLTEQQQRIEELQQQMKETIEEAETSEPLLAEDLYDTYRQMELSQPEQQLQNAADYLQRNWDEQAVSQSEDAATSIEEMREGIEKAAESVLGDELEGLRTARDNLQQLENEVDAELDANAPSENDRQGNGQPDDQTGNQPNDQAGVPSESQANQQSADSRNGEPSGNENPGDENPGDDQENTGGRNNRQSQQPPEDKNEQRQQQQQGQQQQGQQQQGQQQGQPPNQQTGGQQSGQTGQGGQRSQGELAGQRGQGDAQQPTDQPRSWDQWLEEQNGFRPNQSSGTGNVPVRSPFSGDDYRQWVDQLRDVETMISDPELRAEAARIREEAREIRREANRHSQEPNWDLVRMKVAQPLNELKRKVAEEILRRSQDQELVPTDRDPVPNQYRDAVEKYYQRLGIGK